MSKIKIKNANPETLKSEYLVAIGSKDGWVFQGSFSFFPEALEFAARIGGLVFPVSEVELEIGGPKKVYFSDYHGDDASYHVYDKTNLVMDTITDVYKSEGFEECLQAFGFSYCGGFESEKTYLETYKKTKSDVEYVKE